MAGTQGLKTESGLNVVSASIARNPGPVMWVMDSERQARKVSKQRLGPRLARIDELHEKRLHGEKYWNIDEYYFRDSVVRIAGANSPGQRRSWPAKLLILDEVDAYKAATERFADVITDFESRTKAYGDLATRMYISSPTTKEGPIYNLWSLGTQEEYFVPCPHCKKDQVLNFKQIKFESRHPKQARMEAFYQCKHCEKRIDDHHKPAMLEKGYWQATYPERGPAFRSFRWASFNAPQLSWGYFAEQFLNCFPRDSHGYVIPGTGASPRKLQGTMNNDWAEVFETKGTAATVGQILSRRGLKTVHEYSANECPISTPEAIIITADSQSDHFPYEVNAWANFGTCYLLKYGRVDTLGALQKIVDDVVFKGPGPDDRFSITHKGIDSGGTRTDEIYRFCAEFDWMPIKGQHRGLRPQLVKHGKVEDYGLYLLEVATAYFKDIILRKLRISLDDPGSWHVHKDTSTDYADEITSEHAKFVFDQFQRPQRVWVKKSDDRINDFLHAHVYNMAMAHWANIIDRGPDPEPEIRPEQDRTTSQFIENLQRLRERNSKRPRRYRGK